MDIDLNRITQGEGSKQHMPKTWGGYLLSWGEKYLGRVGGEKENLSKGLVSIHSGKNEAATRSGH